MRIITLFAALLLVCWSAYGQTAPPGSATTTYFYTVIGESSLAEIAEAEVLLITRHVETTQSVLLAADKSANGRSLFLRVAPASPTPQAHELILVVQHGAAGQQRTTELAVPDLDCRTDRLYVLELNGDGRPDAIATCRGAKDFLLYAVVSEDGGYQWRPIPEAHGALSGSLPPQFQRDEHGVLIHLDHSPQDPLKDVLRRKTIALRPEKTVVWEFAPKYGPGAVPQNAGKTKNEMLAWVRRKIEEAKARVAQWPAPERIVGAREYPPAFPYGPAASDAACQRLEAARSASGTPQALAIADLKSLARLVDLEPERGYVALIRATPLVSGEAAEWLANALAEGLFEPDFYQALAAAPQDAGRACSMIGYAYREQKNPAAWRDDLARLRLLQAEASLADLSTVMKQCHAAMSAVAGAPR